MEITYINTTQSYNGEIIEITDLNSSLYLKSLGYNKPTISYYLIQDIPYVKKGLYHLNINARKVNHNKSKLCISAPTKSQVKSFLRKYKNE